MPADTAYNTEYYVHTGDFYDAIEACDELDMQLARLLRQDLLPRDRCWESRERVASVRQLLQEHISRHDLTPKGPRLP